MTRYFDDGESLPGTHVLLIGVGGYPFLAKGSADPEQRLPEEAGITMESLTSPEKSVEMLGQWFQDRQHGFHNPDRPVRSMEILCSATGGDGGGSGRATAQEIERAAVAWKKRADRNSENITLFYFCGHGMTFGGMDGVTLLAEDFGKNHHNPMDDAISFSEMRLGFRAQCKAKYQCFFIDACRNLVPPEYALHYGTESTGKPIFSTAPSARMRGKHSPTFFASEFTETAYGLRNRPSVFAEALLACFRGSGTRGYDDQYEVPIAAIAEGVNKCLAGSRSLTAVDTQCCQPSETGCPLTLHYLRHIPEVMVKITIQDRSKLAVSLLSYRHEHAPAPTVREPPCGQDWWTLLPLGQYRFDAKSQSTGRSIGSATRRILPPGDEVGL